MTSKLNIFNSLPQHASDSEDEVTIKNAKTKSTHEKRDQRKQEGAKGAHGHAAPRDPNQKEDVTRSKNQQKQKLTSEAHPNDRQSGTGTQAYGGKPKKGGAGKGNWGNFKEDRKPTGEEGEEVESPEVVEEEKPEGLTLAEYLANKRTAPSSQPQVNEAKSKITSEQLMKEVGKATLLKNRTQQDIDDKKVGTKKGKLDVDHHAGINTEHSELLNFRTGFVEREYKERSRDGDAPAPRKFGGRREERTKEEQPAEATAEATTETTPAEGAATTEAKPEEAAQKKPYQKGARGGYKGDRPQGERRPYANKPTAAKVNFEDESAFPKLG